MKRQTRLHFLLLALGLLAGCRNVPGVVESAATIADVRPDPRVVAEAWSRALVDGPMSMSLDWVRPESRVLLVRRPEVMERTRDRVASLGDLARLELVVHGERAALRDAADAAAPPILLLFDGEGWRIDVVEVEKSYAAARDGRLDPAANSRNPYRRLAPPPARKTFADLSEIDLYAEPIEDVIERLGRAEDPESRFRLAEILLRNCWLVDEALDQYEAAIRIQGQRVSMDRFGKFAEDAGVPDRAIPIAREFELMSDRVLAGLHQRAGRFDKSKIYIERLIAEATMPVEGATLIPPASAGEPIKP